MKSKFAKSESEPYKPSIVEKKWQELWGKNKIYSPNLDSAKKPFYNLMMFPYPSADGMHVGNMYAFTGADIYGRFMRMKGFNVFEPIGLDGFGIHSENYAIKVGRHPKEQAKISEENFYRQLRATGNGFDWSRTLKTYDPKYYKWTQWLFIQLFKAGLAYRKKASVFFCPSCKTVLADEQVVESKCERCSSIVKRKNLEQWFFKITSYAERLLSNIEKLNWTEKVKLAQKQWIGKSEGTRIKFKIKDRKGEIEVFTTRPDTLFGATFLALAPEHPIVSKIAIGKDVMNYLSGALIRKKEEREKDKKGIDTGYKAINPITQEEIPIWVVDYVLMDYGTGAIMGVPAHDERDFEFAKKYNLPIKQVIVYQESTKPPQGWTTREVGYHLRDWLISRQRYWGPPIPMIYCEMCAHSSHPDVSGSKSPKSEMPKQSMKQVQDMVEHDKENGMAGWFPVPEEDLPVLLPDVKDWKPKGTGKSPLASVESFVNTKCPNCKSPAKRETDVSDTFLDSSWYFFRYTSTDIESRCFDIKRVKKWLPVKTYIGGAEHSVLHLLYSRFITMALYDLGFISFEEPFSRFYAHGLLIKEGAKMSKSKENVVIPDEYIKKYGADTLRCYLMFLGPFDHGGDFYDTGIEGMYRFIKRVWTLVSEALSIKYKVLSINKDETQKLDQFMHKTVKLVSEDLEDLRYNTAIAHIMEYYNELHSYYTQYKTLNTKYCKTLVLLLAPFAPHMTEDLWQRLRGPVRGFPPASARSSLASSNELRAVGSLSASATPQFNSIHTQPWPKYNPKFLEEKRATIVVQVNGKVRDTLESQISNVKSQMSIENKAKESEKIRKYLQGKTIKKVVYVEGKIINFVTE